MVIALGARPLLWSRPGPGSARGHGPREKRHKGVDGIHTAAGLALSHTKAQGAVLQRLGPLGLAFPRGSRQALPAAHRVTGAGGTFTALGI